MHFSIPQCENSVYAVRAIIQSTHYRPTPLKMHRGSYCFWMIFLNRRKKSGPRRQSALSSRAPVAVWPVCLLVMSLPSSSAGRGQGLASRTARRRPHTVGWWALQPSPRLPHSFLLIQLLSCRCLFMETSIHHDFVKHQTLHEAQEP